MNQIRLVEKLIAIILCSIKSIAKELYKILKAVNCLISSEYKRIFVIYTKIIFQFKIHGMSDNLKGIPSRLLFSIQLTLSQLDS